MDNNLSMMLLVFFVLLSSFRGDCHSVQVNALSQSWTWISGSNTRNQNGTYGTKGVTSSLNVPGSRLYTISWIDSDDNLWLFGGFDATGNFGWFNDLWKFDGKYWTWISGANVADQLGIYGTQGIASSLNVPGSRDYAISWIDKNDNLWLFGGYGKDTTGNNGELNDLWKFDGKYWTWISGANTVNKKGIYGTQGVVSSLNVPGSRFGAISWIDKNDTLWLFSGWGFDATGSFGGLNDLWKFNGMNWIWISGANVADQLGIYGTQGVASSLNVPGSRWNAISWIDSNDNLWLFGGVGYAATGNLGMLNDLWKFDRSEDL